MTQEGPFHRVARTQPENVQKALSMGPGTHANRKRFRLGSQGFAAGL